MLILDEINNAIHYGMISLERVLADLAERPKRATRNLHRSRRARKLIEAADLVSEIREIKHPYQTGSLAQRGIEY